jgi:glycerate kinase
MNYLIAPDKFKGSLSALAVAEAMAAGVKMADPEASIQLLPLADGGDGTAEILRLHSQGTWVTVEVMDPLHRPIEASYALSGDGTTAFIEMAQASGLALLEEAERNALHTSTFGTGELILHAWEAGVRDMVLGIGGSATSEVGMGMAQALGYRFLDADGQALVPRGENLQRIQRIDASNLKLDPTQLRLRVACDVSNPLYGPSGAAVIYGPQKGATPEAVAQLDAGAKQMAHCIHQDLGLDLAAVAGGGAAGGLGAGAIAFLGGELMSGIDLVMEVLKIEERLANVDLILTGEGLLDAQTLTGKVIAGLCQRAGKHGIPVAALCGSVAAPAEDWQQLGLTFAASILSRPIPLAEAMQPEIAQKGLRELAFSVVRLFLA